MAKQRYTADQVAAALHATKGMVFLAAKHLGCSHDTIERYMQRYPTVAAACQFERGAMVDTAELALWNALQHSEAWAVQFALRTLGKDRGYVPQLDTKDLSDHTGLADLLRAARAPLENGSSHGLPGSESARTNGHAPTD